MDSHRATLLLNSLSELMGYSPDQRPVANAWPICSNDGREGWFVLEDFGGGAIVAVARFPVCQVPREQQSGFLRDLLLLTGRVPALGSLVLEQGGRIAVSVAVADLRFTDNPAALSDAVNRAIGLADMALEELDAYLG